MGNQGNLSSTFRKPSCCFTGARPTASPTPPTPSPTLSPTMLNPGPPFGCTSRSYFFARNDSHSQDITTGNSERRCYIIVGGNRNLFVRGQLRMETNFDFVSVFAVGYRHDMMDDNSPTGPDSANVSVLIPRTDSGSRRFEYVLVDPYLVIMTDTDGSVSSSFTFTFALTNEEPRIGSLQEDDGMQDSTVLASLAGFGAVCLVALTGVVAMRVRRAKHHRNSRAPPRRTSRNGWQLSPAVTGLNPNRAGPAGRRSYVQPSVVSSANSDSLHPSAFLEEQQPRNGVEVSVVVADVDYSILLTNNHATSEGVPVARA